MTELIETLRTAQHEIQSLRRQNEILAAKVEVMDGFMQVLRTTPAQRPQSFAPDIVFGLEQHVARLEDERTPKAAPRQPPVDNAHVADDCEKF